MILLLYFFYFWFFVFFFCFFFFFFSSRRRHTRWPRDWSSDVCSSDLPKRWSRRSKSSPCWTRSAVRLLSWHRTHHRSASRRSRQSPIVPRRSWACTFSIPYTR